LLIVSVGSRTWHVPAGAAFWIPSGRQIDVQAVSAPALRTFTLTARDDAPREFDVLRLSALMRAVLDRLTSLPAVDVRVPAHRHLLTVLSDELQAAVRLPLGLQWPTDPRAADAAWIIARDPSDTLTLEDVASGAGVSGRTLERVFLEDTGRSFGEWRRRARFTAALELLVARRAVADVALEVGYGSTSAFIGAFRDALGATPKEISKLMKGAATEADRGKDHQGGENRDSTGFTRLTIRGRSHTLPRHVG